MKLLRLLIQAKGKYIIEEVNVAKVFEAKNGDHTEKVYYLPDVPDVLFESELAKSGFYLGWGDLGAQLHLCGKNSGLADTQGLSIIDANELYKVLQNYISFTTNEEISRQIASIGIAVDLAAPENSVITFPNAHTHDAEDASIKFDARNSLGDAVDKLKKRLMIMCSAEAACESFKKKGYKVSYFIISQSLHFVVEKDGINAFAESEIFLDELNKANDFNFCTNLLKLSKKRIQEVWKQLSAD